MDDDRFPPAPTISPTIEGPDRSWLRTAIGATLVVFGFELLLQRLLDRDLPLAYIAFGLVLLAAWFRTQNGICLVAGSLVVGSGGGVFVSAVLGDLFGFAVPLGVAAGFRLIYALSPDAGWARIPFVISMVVALAELASTLGATDAITSILGEVAAPIAVIILGTLVVARRRLAPRTFMLGAATAGCFGLIALGASGSDLSLSMPNLSSEATREVVVEVPDLNGDTLAIETTAGNVTVRTGEDLQVRALVHARAHDELAARERAAEAEFDVEQDDGELLVELDRQRHTTASYDVTVPAGTDVRVDVAAGNVKVDLASGNVEVEAGAGKVSVDLDAPGDVLIDVRTGNVDVSLVGAPAIDARSQVGSISDGNTRVRGGHLIRDGDDGSLTVDLGVGSIDIDLREVSTGAGLR